MFTKYDQQSKQYSVKMNNSVIMKDDSDVTTGTCKHTLYKLFDNFQLKYTYMRKKYS